MFILAMLFLFPIIAPAVFMIFAAIAIVRQNAKDSAPLMPVMPEIKPRYYNNPKPSRQQPKPQPKPEPEPEKPKFLSLQQFVEKNIDLLDTLTNKKETFVLSEEILKDLDDEGLIKLSAWLTDMWHVDYVIGKREKFVVHMSL